MELRNGWIRVHDTAANKDATLIHIIPPSFQQAANPVPTGASYFIAPVESECSAIIAYDDDNTLHIQKISKLKLLA